MQTTRAVTMRSRTLLSVCAAALMSAAPGCAPLAANSGIRLNGAGSTFAYPPYTQWASSFGSVRPDVAIDYETTIGSSGGINLVTDGRVDFGATDGPMTDAQLDTFARQRNCGVLHVPTALGAVVAAYNVPGINAELKFTPQAGRHLPRIHH